MLRQESGVNLLCDLDIAMAEILADPLNGLARGKHLHSNGVAYLVNADT